METLGLKRLVLVTAAIVAIVVPAFVFAFNEFSYTVITTPFRAPEPTQTASHCTGPACKTPEHVQLPTPAESASAAPAVAAVADTPAATQVTATRAVVAGNTGACGAAGRLAGGSCAVAAPVTTVDSPRVERVTPPGLISPPAPSKPAERTTVGATPTAAPKVVQVPVFTTQSSSQQPSSPSPAQQAEPTPTANATSTPAPVVTPAKTPAPTPAKQPTPTPTVIAVETPPSCDSHNDDKCDDHKGGGGHASPNNNVNVANTGTASPNNNRAQVAPETIPSPPPVTTTAGTQDTGGKPNGPRKGGASTPPPPVAVTPAGRDDDDHRDAKALTSSVQPVSMKGNGSSNRRDKSGKRGNNNSGPAVSVLSATSFVGKPVEGSGQRDD